MRATGSTETSAEMRDFFGIPVTYKIGIETFDHDFRENVLNKHADFQSPEEVAALFDSICLMVGIQGTDKRDDPQRYLCSEKIF